jgi:hypothetical protein
VIFSYYSPEVKDDKDIDYTSVEYSRDFDGVSKGIF